MVGIMCGTLAHQGASYHLDGAKHMNGRELERILQLIEANANLNRPLLRQEVLSYISEHEDEILHDLRERNSATVHTSAGRVELKLAELEAAFA